MEKKKYEAPVVTRVAIEFSDRIIAFDCSFSLGDSACGNHASQS